ncbi:MAG: insulinase family protein, partial [Spirochaetaceae bacterium]|nr:insulinase family protein [Spirochaetaceae bacterium]
MSRRVLWPVVFAVLVISSLAGGCAGFSARQDLYGGLGQGADPVPLMSKARTGKLPNGMRYYILENSLPENRAFLTLAVNAGSVLEKEDERGLAHFVEHMSFNGTARFPESELLDYLRSLGMRFGADANAFTSFDFTFYGFDVPVEATGGLKRIPAKALAIIDDWAHGVSFDAEAVENERSVIIEEYRTRLGAAERLQRKIVPILLEGSPYAERLPIGLPEIIQGAPASRLENFYKTWYRADNMAVILVGDFDAAVMEAELAAHMSAPAPAEPLRRPVYELPPPARGRLRVEMLKDSELSFTSVETYYKAERQPRRGDLENFRQDLIDFLISRMISDRLQEAALNPDSPYTKADAGESRYGLESRYYLFSATAKPDKVRETLEAVLREKEAVRRYGFTGTEIDRAKRELNSYLLRMVSEKDRQESAYYVNALASHFLKGEYAADAEWEFEAMTAMLPGVSAKEINRAAAAYYEANDLTILVLAPEAAGLPTEAELRGIVTASRKARIPRPTEEAVSDKLLEADPVPGSILSESRDADTGAVLWELSNGARVILRETANKNNEIVLYAMARGGTDSVTEAESASARIAAEMANTSGLGPYSQTELIKKLAGTQAYLSFQTGTFFRTLNGGAVKGDAKKLFEMLYLAFTQPRIENGAARSLLEQYRTALAQRNEDPEAVYYDELTRIIYGGDYHYRPWDLAYLETVDIAQARSFLTRCVNPGDYTFIFTGNLDLPALRQYTETYLASIPSGESWNRFGDFTLKRPGKLDKAVYKGKEEKSTVFLGWYMDEAFSPAGYAAAAALTEYLDIRLTEEIREKRGGVYSIYGSAALSPTPPPRGELILNSIFDCDPRRAVELSDAVVQQIELIAQGTINRDTFTKAIEALKKGHE